MLSLTPSQQHWFDFLLAMTEKEIKARYKFAVLGFLWIVLNPLLQMAVIGVIFQFFIKVPADNYFLFLFSGLLIWNFFSYTITKNTPMILNERGLISKAKFPREAIIFSVVLANLFHSLVAFVLLIIAAIFLLNFTFIKSILFLLGIIIIFFYTAGFSLLFSALNVKYRDVNFFVQAVMPLWFYVTPLVYTRSLLPEWAQILLLFNPLTSVIELFQSIFANAQAPSAFAIGISLFVSLIIFASSWLFFNREALFFDDWV